MNKKRWFLTSELALNLVQAGGFPSFSRIFRWFSMVTSIPKWSPLGVPGGLGIEDALGPDGEAWR